MKIKVLIVAVCVIVAFCAAARAVSVTTTFGPIELEGAPGLFGSATAVISIYQTTPTGGIIDFAVTNTSLRTELEPGKFANAFITEFQFDLPDDYEVIFADSSVIARIGVRFSDGPNDPVVATGIDRTLQWSFGTGTGGGMFARDFEASNDSNKNAIFGADTLNGSGVPVEDYADGFLKKKWDYAVFDEIIFRVKLEDSEPISEEDLAFFQCDHLTLKFQGGEGSVWSPNECEIVSEPSTLALIGAGLVGGIATIIRKRRRS